MSEQNKEELSKEQENDFDALVKHHEDRMKSAITAYVNKHGLQTKLTTTLSVYMYEIAKLNATLQNTLAVLRKSGHEHSANINARRKERLKKRAKQS